MTADPAPSLRLAFGLPFEALYDDARLPALDAHFCAQLAAADGALAQRLEGARAQPAALAPLDESALLIALAPHLDAFIGTLFGIGEEIRALAAGHHARAPLYAVKRQFVQRQAAVHLTPAQAAAQDGAALAAALEALLGEPLTETSFARHVAAWLDAPDAHAPALDLARRYAAWALHAPAGRARHGVGVLFQQPHKLDPQRLVPTETRAAAGTAVQVLPEDRLRRREGFALTDPGHDLTRALDQAHYCIVCHPQGRDSCRAGLHEKSGAVRRSAHGVPLHGCPLDEKISEMNHLKAAGVPVGALAVAMVDNPLLAGTGHRICNDCMKACIYQKQDPVDIPQIETRALKDVLALPWGFEVYSLLTRWNPLNLRRPLPRAPSGRTVLVAGLGPAGYTLAHHLMQDGHGVIAVDGLKIEPLDPALSGVDAHGARVPFAPVHDIATLHEPLDRRVMAGFGGVAEYGITVRWDKNFLTVIRLLLERRARFALYGGVRLGGTLRIEDAFALGFDHVALCLGAGRPQVVGMENGLAPGVRQASDFLMALQLTGAARADSIANLELRLPAVVIGGGLTAVDTATEALAYYPVQVEKFLRRYETLRGEQGEAGVRGAWTPAEAAIADEFLAHARALRAEREAAAREGRAPRIRELLDAWGGVTIAYRRALTQSPAYTLNHEEVHKALEEGVRFAELLAPRRVELDGAGRAAALVCERQALTAGGEPAGTGETVTLPARAVLVAAGTTPNTVIARADGEPLTLDGRHFQALGADGGAVTPERSPKPAQAAVLTHLTADGRAVSFFGDLHPSYAGNVVKAMASAKQGYPVVSAALAGRPPACAGGFATLRGEMDARLRARVVRVERLTPGIVEVTVHAPAAAARFRPGQFFRFHNHESHARRADGTLLAMEGLALTGARVDAAAGTVSLIVLEMGGSSDLCARLAPGEPVVLMGPTGTATETPGGETVLLAGGGLGNAVLFSIGQALRAAGSRVLYFAGYKQAQDRYHAADIEAAADVVVWACDQAPGFTPDRAQDRAFVGNIVAAMAAYAEGGLGAPAIPLRAVTRLIAIGSDRMMAAVAAARHGVLAAHLGPHVALGSINSPMQCMMKEICGQCLQAHRDPASGRLTQVVFSCTAQDQPLDAVDFACLADRLAQNAVQEKLTAQWVRRALETGASPRKGRRLDPSAGD